MRFRCAPICALAAASALATAGTWSCLGEDPTYGPPANDAGRSETDGSRSRREDASDGDAGAMPHVTGNPRWHRSIVAPSGTVVRLTGGAIDPEGNVLVTGTAEAETGTAAVDFGDGRLLDVYATNGREAFVARYDASGACQWAQLVGGKGSESLYRVAFTAEGDIVAVGDTVGALGASVIVDNIALGKPANGGARDIVLVKLDSAGKRIWHKVYGGPNSDGAEAMAISPTGDIFIGGSVTRSTTADDVTFPPKSLSFEPSPGRVAFAALLDKDGAAKWAWAYRSLEGAGASSESRVLATAFGAQGEVVIAGSFDHSIDLRTAQSGSPLALQRRGSTGRDGFVAKLAETDGQTSWGVQLGGDFDDVANDVAVDSARNVYVAGIYTGPGPVQIGGHAMPAFGGAEAFVTKIDGSGSTHEWSRGFGSALTDEAHSLSIDPWGNVVLSGVQDAPITWGGKTTSGGGSRDAFVVKLDALAQTGLWSWGLGSRVEDAAAKMAVASGSGRTLLIATLTGAATLAGKPLPLADAGAASYGFVLVLDP